MRILESKGHLQHEQEKARYIYKPTRTRRAAAKTALRRVVQTFFDGSAEKAVSTLVDSGELSAQDLDAIKSCIEDARRRKK